MRGPALAAAITLALSGGVFAQRAAPGPAAGGAAAAFPQGFLGSISLALSAQPFYGSMLLSGFEGHLAAVVALPRPQAAAIYLERAVAGEAGLKAEAAGLKARLGREALPAPVASALLLANAVARPEQFSEILSGLEARKPGLGKQLQRMLRETRGAGDQRLIAHLRGVGEKVRPRGVPLTYNAQGELNAFFDGSATPVSGADVFAPSVPIPEGFTGYGPDGRLRRSGLRPAPTPAGREPR